ncbi:MAG TPA: SCO family protein [Phototrophicaceae bacterium]|nr:SCO family protein [Phototrophicaceae bacterium]
MLRSVQHLMRVVAPLLLVALLAACAAQPAATLPPKATAGTSEITVISPPQAMTDFTLTNQAGETVHLSDFKGKLVVLAFGYTHCPDVCPITLARFKQIKAQLKEQAEEVEFVWISVDGARDTPEHIRQYLNNFDPEFNGLTSDSETVRGIIGEYGGIFELNNAGGLRKENYTVDHTASHFLLDTEGRWIRTYAYGSEIATIVADLKKLLA